MDCQANLELQVTIMLGGLVKLTSHKFVIVSSQLNAITLIWGFDNNYEIEYVQKNYKGPPTYSLPNNIVATNFWS